MLFHENSLLPGTDELDRLYKVTVVLPQDDGGRVNAGLQRDGIRFQRVFAGCLEFIHHERYTVAHHIRDFEGHMAFGRQ